MVGGYGWVIRDGWVWAEIGRKGWEWEWEDGFGARGKGGIQGEVG